MSNQGNRDQKDNLGRPGKDAEKPAGTTGRTGNTGAEDWKQGNTDTNRRPAGQDEDDEDSGLGNRTGLR